MRLATFTRGGGSARLGLIVSSGILDVSRHLPDVPHDMTQLIAGWPRFCPKLLGILGRPADHAISDIKLHPPVIGPRNIFAIGLNYADHIAESGLESPAHQIWFSKAATSLTGPFDPIQLPAVSEQLDYECELVIVIGRRCRNVPRTRAKEAIFGYCVGDDVSVRDWQLRTSQWVIGKSVSYTHLRA